MLFIYDVHTCALKQHDSLLFVHPLFNPVSLQSRSTHVSRLHVVQSTLSHMACVNTARTELGRVWSIWVQAPDAARFGGGDGSGKALGSSWKPDVEGMGTSWP